MVSRTSITIGTAITLVVSLMVTAFYKRENDFSSRHLENESILSSEQVNLEAPLESRRSLTYADLARGQALEPSDEDLRNWVEGNAHSESAWLAVHSFRFDWDISNKWMAESLSRNPDSKPLVAMAANLELLQFHSNPEAASRKWLDHFIAIDPDNSLPWLMSAIAEYSQGNIDKGDQLWIKAGQATEMNIHAAEFDEPVQEFLVEHFGASESIAEIYGWANIPALNLPKLNQYFNEVKSRALSFLDSDKTAEGEALIEAGCQIGFNLCEVEGAGNNSIYILSGICAYQTFIEAAPFETQLALAKKTAEVDQAVEGFRKNKRPPVENFTESQFLWWNAARQELGSFVARQMFGDSQ